MRISTGNFDSIFFLWITLFLNFEIWQKWKILLKQLVSATPLKLLNRIAWNFVVMKDIMCRYAFLQEMLIWSFWGAIYIPFFLQLPVTNAWNCHSYSILKQCWSVGYVSLLTLSFISPSDGTLNGAPCSSVGWDVKWCPVFLATLKTVSLGLKKSRLLRATRETSQFHNSSIFFNSMMLYIFTEY